MKILHEFKVWWEVKQINLIFKSIRIITLLKIINKIGDFFNEFGNSETNNFKTKCEIQSKCNYQITFAQTDSFLFTENLFNRTELSSLWSSNKCDISLFTQKYISKWASPWDQQRYCAILEIEWINMIFMQNKKS